MASFVDTTKKTGRWTNQEQECLEKVKERLGDKLTSRPQYPEVVGDRKLMKFIQGHDCVVDKVVEMVESFFQWRDGPYKVDDIRADIVDNNLDHPSKFPNGETILRLNPMMVYNATSIDAEGSYVSAEGTIPKGLWKSSGGSDGVEAEEYIRFRIYCLEYLTIILEKQADAHEKEHPEDGGVLKKITVVRNLAGLSMSDFAGTNKKVAGELMTIASNHYPEMLKKYFVVNTPWAFTAIFAIIKVFLAKKTIDKVNVLGSSFMSTLGKMVPATLLPDFIDGSLEIMNTPADISMGDTAK